MNAYRYEPAPPETQSDGMGFLHQPKQATKLMPRSDSGIVWTQNPMYVTCCYCESTDVTAIVDKSSCLNKMCNNPTLIEHYCKNAPCKKKVGEWKKQKQSSASK